MSLVVRHVLFPGRHHLVTSFQTRYLRALLAGELVDSAGVAVVCAVDADVVWAITSATHSGTRRNPLPGHRRGAMVERVSAVEGLASLVAPVADVPASPRFARTVLASVELSTGVVATPEDTVLACSTPRVAAMYAELGFRVVAVEDGDPAGPARPWDVLEMVAAGDGRWRELAHPEVVRFYDRYGLAAQVALIHADPTVSTEGDLTSTRDYRSYTAAFDDASDRKWELVSAFVEPGRVVDLGCAAGGLLERAARDPRLAESDLYGVDVSRHLVAEAEHRRAQGVFAHPNVFFAQRNLLRSAVFPVASVSTTLTVALTHEIASYGAGRADLERLAERIFEHTAPGGVWVCSDVLGPQEGDRLVHLVLDGVGAGVAPRDLAGLDGEDVAAVVGAMSPAERLVQFAQDFPALSGGRCDVRWVGDGVAELTLRAAMEFLTTRDYVDSWLSECHERFCDMTWPDWVELLEGVGFGVEPVSGAWRNEWLVENRLSGGGVVAGRGDGCGAGLAADARHVRGAAPSVTGRQRADVESTARSRVCGLLSNASTQRGDAP